MSALNVIILACGMWGVIVLAFYTLVRPRFTAIGDGDSINGFMWHVSRFAMRLIHRVQYEGEDQLRNRNQTGPLVVISNHTGSVDPILIQCGCRFQIRWMMARETMLDGLDWLWDRQQVIGVDRDGKDSGPLREAIRHVKAGGALGIFPEGGLFQPPCEIRPFAEGAGFIIARTSAPVLLVWISGTPHTKRMAQSIFSPSRARVVFRLLPAFDRKHDATAISRMLRGELSGTSGWPLNDTPIRSGAPGAERVGSTA